MLEIVDGAFDEIAGEVDEYRTAIARKTPTQLSNTEINSLATATSAAIAIGINSLCWPFVRGRRAD
jgi:hypothetical protein